MADDSRNADVGAPYAQALFGLANEANALSVVEADLKSLDRARNESTELRSFLASPLFGHEDKGKVLIAIADAVGVSPLTRNFVGLLCANHRASALPAVIAAFEKLAAAQRGQVAAEVTSAVALTAEQRADIANVLRQLLGKDPEIKSTPSGTMVATFGLATSDRYQDPQGNWQDRTEWHNLVAFKRTAEIVRDYVKKGSKLYKTEIIVNDLSLLSGRDEGSGGGGYSRGNDAANYDQRPPAQREDIGQQAEISDDDIPF